MASTISFLYGSGTQNGIDFYNTPQSYQFLTSWEKQGNRTRARIRSRIEHVFGCMTQRTGNLILRTVGISRAEVKLGLRNIAYNMERFCFLMRQTA